MIFYPGALVAERDTRRQHDWPLIGSALALSGVGMAAIASVDSVVAHKAGVLGGFAVKQALLGVVGLMMMVLLSFSNTELWRRLAPVIYWVNFGLLAAVTLFGRTINGSKRWLVIGNFTLQPSDFTKVMVVLTLAAFFAANLEKIREWSTFWKSLLHIVPFIALTVLQPHYGSAALIMGAWFLIAVCAGVSWKKVGSVVAAMVMLLTAAVLAPGLLKGVLKDYHLQRIENLVDEVVHGKKDSAGKGFQQEQSEIAIGVGGTFGSGYGRGVRKAAGYVPEQQSDYIFSVIGEEFGFVGSVAVLGLLGFFLYRVWLVGYRCKNEMDRFVATGILAVIGGHAVANLAMVLHIGLTIGLWLPFLSAGGTGLIVCLAMVGLLDSLR